MKNLNLDQSFDMSYPSVNNRVTFYNSCSFKFKMCVVQDTTGSEWKLCKIREILLDSCQWNNCPHSENSIFICSKTKTLELKI